MLNEPKIEQKHIKTFVVTGGSDGLGAAFGRRCCNADIK
jgi:short-subunit dehydrogenase